MTRKRLPAKIAWSAALTIALALPVAGQAPDLQSLGPAVEDFLLSWMRGKTEEAAKRYLSTVSAEKPQLLPSGVSRDRPLTAGQDAHQALATELADIRQALWGTRTPDTILAPTRSADAIPDVAPIVRELGLDLVPLQRPPALAFPVRRWADVAWTGSAGPRHREVFDGPGVGRQAFYGVIVRLRSEQSSASPLPVLLVWRHEPVGADKPAWKFVTMFPILTN